QGWMPPGLGQPGTAPNGARSGRYVTSRPGSSEITTEGKANRGRPYQTCRRTIVSPGDQLTPRGPRAVGSGRGRSRQGGRHSRGPEECLRDRRRPHRPQPAKVLRRGPEQRVVGDPAQELGVVVVESEHPAELLRRVRRLGTDRHVAVRRLPRTGDVPTSAGG